MKRKYLENVINIAVYKPAIIKQENNLLKRKKKTKTTEHVLLELKVLQSSHTPVKEIFNKIL